MTELNEMTRTKKTNCHENVEETIRHSLFTHSVYIAIISSTNSTDPPRFLCDSLISDAFPPLLSMKWSISSVMFVSWKGGWGEGDDWDDYVM